MKKVLGILAVGLMATAANAATIGLTWAESAGQNLDAMQGTIQVNLALLGGESVSGVIFDYSAPGSNLAVTAQTANKPGWAQNGTTGPLNGRQFLAFANTAADNLVGPMAKSVVGTTVVSAPLPADGSIANIFALIPQNAVAVADGSGAKMTWDARYNESTAGYIAFGDFGNPGWGTKTTKGHQPTASPLQLTKVPEPTSLALIALGGFALLRRR